MTLDNLQARQIQIAQAQSILSQASEARGTPTQEAAVSYAKLGIATFAVAWRGKKPLHKWAMFKHTRLLPEFTSWAYEGQPCNLAVVCGAISGNLVIVDADSIESANLWTGAFKQAGIPLYAVNTRRGLHLYLKLSSGELSNISAPGQYDILGNSKYAVGVSSQHETGHIYSYHHRDSDSVPTVSLDKLKEAMSYLPDNLQVPLVLNTKAKHQLTAQTQAYLAGQTQTARNNQAFTSTNELLASGYSVDDTMSLIMQGALGCGLPESEAANCVLSAIKTQAQPKTQTRQKLHTPTQAALQGYFAHLDTLDFVGQLGTTDKAVCEALGQRAIMSRVKVWTTRGVRQTSHFRATLRGLATLADISISTLRRSLARLQKRGLLAFKQLRGTNNRLAKLTWQSETVGHSEYSRVLRTQNCLFTVLIVANHLAFSRGVLGGSAYAVLAVLAQDKAGLPQAAIAKTGKLSVSQARTALTSLCKHSLVLKVETGKRRYAYKLAVSVEDLPSRLDTIGLNSGRHEARAKNAHRYAIERQVNACNVIRLARGLRPIDKHGNVRQKSVKAERRKRGQSQLRQLLIEAQAKAKPPVEVVVLDTKAKSLTKTREADKLGHLHPSILRMREADNKALREAVAKPYKVTQDGIVYEVLDLYNGNEAGRWCHGVSLDKQGACVWLTTVQVEDYLHHCKHKTGVTA